MVQLDVGPSCICTCSICMVVHKQNNENKEVFSFSADTVERTLFARTNLSKVRSLRIAWWEVATSERGRGG